MFASLRRGLGTIPQRLAAWDAITVRTSTTVRAIRRTPTGFALDCGPVSEAELVEADAVIVATPAAKAALLLRDVAPAAAAELHGVESASVAITTLAFRDVHLPAGSGLLVGANEGFGVKAVTLSSQKWPLETGGLTLLRASVGRAGENHVLQRSDDDLIAVVRHELRALIGVDTEPVDALVTRWGGGLPQYAVGHVDMVARVRAAVSAVPGLGVCGAAYDGVGIPACIASAQGAADQVLASLRELARCLVERAAKEHKGRERVAERGSFSPKLVAIFATDAARLFDKAAFARPLGEVGADQSHQTPAQHAQPQPLLFT